MDKSDNQKDPQNSNNTEENVTISTSDPMDPSIDYNASGQAKDSSDPLAQLKSENSVLKARVNNLEARVKELEQTVTDALIAFDDETTKKDNIIKDLKAKLDSKESKSEAPSKYGEMECVDGVCKPKVQPKTGTKEETKSEEAPAKENAEPLKLNVTLVDNTGKTTSVESLKEVPTKIKAIYFSAHWCPPCRNFTPKLIKFYNEVNKTEKQLEVIFISRDKNEAEFKNYFADMPWLAVDYNQANERNMIARHYAVNGIPALLIVNEEGKAFDVNARNDVEAAKTDGDYTKVIDKWLSTKTFAKIPDASALPPKNLQMQLITPPQPFNFGALDTAGKAIAFKDTETPVRLLYFCMGTAPSNQFTAKLINFYNTVNKDSKKLEIIYVSLDNEEKVFKETFAKMPWLTLDYKDPMRTILPRVYQVMNVPRLIPVDITGKELTKDLMPAIVHIKESQFVQTFGIWEKISTGQMANPSLNPQAHQPPQAPHGHNHGNQPHNCADHPPGQHGGPQPVATTKAQSPVKTIDAENVTMDDLKIIDNKGSSTSSFKDSTVKVRALYFSAHWCPPCRNFTPILAKFYNEINKESKRFEVVFVSWDREKKEFQEYFKTMPWLAVDYDQAQIRTALNSKYSVTGIPKLLIVDEAGNVLDSTYARVEVEKSNEAQYEKVFDRWSHLGTKKDI
jgi:nucleoredoxin